MRGLRCQMLLVLMGLCRVGCWLHRHLLRDCNSSSPSEHRALAPAPLHIKADLTSTQTRLSANSSIPSPHFPLSPMKIQKYNKPAANVSPPLTGSSQKTHPPRRQATARHCRRPPRTDQRPPRPASRGPRSRAQGGHREGQGEEGEEREREEGGEGEECGRGREGECGCFREAAVKVGGEQDGGEGGGKDEVEGWWRLLGGGWLRAIQGGWGRLVWSCPSIDTALCSL